MLLILIGVDLGGRRIIKKAFFLKIVPKWWKNVTFATKIVCYEEANQHCGLPIGLAFAVWLLRLIAVARHAEGGASIGAAGAAVEEAV